MRLPIFAAVMLGALSAHAADAGSSEPDRETRRDRHRVIGGNLGVVDASSRLGPSLGFSFDLMMRQRLRKHFAFVGGLRPYYERYALSHSDDRSCIFEPHAACSGGFTMYRSSVTAHSLGLEVPLIGEYRSAGGTAIFVGVGPSLAWLRVNERARGLMPRNGDPTDDTAARVYLMLTTFVGVSVPVSAHGSLTARVGYRFAASSDLPGGSMSLRGELASLGYAYEL